MKNPETESSAVIGFGVRAHLASELHAEGDIEVYGTIEGDIRCQSLLVGSSGHISGSVIADTVEIKGHSASEITAGHLLLRDGSEASGNIGYTTITVDAGATLNATLTRIEPTATTAEATIDATIDTPGEQEATDE